MKTFLPILCLAGALAIGIGVATHVRASGQQQAEPAHLTVAIDEDSQPVAAWVTSTGEPVPLQQLHEMMLGAQPPNWDNTVRWMRGGMWVMPQPPKDAGAAPTATNLITRIITCQCDEDFASIPAGYFGLNPNTCTCPGIRLGDRCMNPGLTIANPSDAGSAYPIGAEVVAVARADNLIELQLYNQKGDGGALDLPDAGYISTCFSNAPLTP